jgi:CHAT domain-containing protein
LLFSGASNFLNYDASKSSGDNGILTAFEVMNMDLIGTELVVMSACETGLGEVMNGEGVYGLQRAFQVAGAKSIIMSLWTVDDRTTQELMVEFYKRYFSGMSKIDSFKEAILEIKER